MRKLPKRIRDYLKVESTRCKPITVAGYRVGLGCFYDYLKTKTQKPITSLTQTQLQGYFAHLCGKNLAPYTRVTYLFSVKKYLQWEVEQGKIVEELLSVLDQSKLPPVPEYLPRPLSKENDRLLQDILRKSDSSHAPLFLLLRQTGLRISELINLPPDCVHTGLKNEKYLKVPLGKLNTERLLPLSEEALLLIEKIRQSHNGGEADRLIGMEGKVSQVYGILSRHFKTLSGDMVDQNKPVTFHRLRHTYATSLLTGGVSLVSLMKLLGHKRIEMTLRYAKVTPSHLRDEYLKAIRTLENQTIVTPANKMAEVTGAYEPVNVIAHLIAFLTKTATAQSSQQKNLLRRLCRLQRDISQISFPQKFKLASPQAECLVGLTG